MPKRTKSRALYILKYLWLYTDDEHPASISDLTGYLAKNGMEAHRTTVSADIAELGNIGIDIIATWKTQMWTAQDPPMAILKSDMMTAPVRGSMIRPDIRCRGTVTGCMRTVQAANGMRYMVRLLWSTDLYMRTGCRFTMVTA